MQRLLLGDQVADGAVLGQNSCKGHSFKGMAAKECLAKDGTIGDLVAKK